MKYTNTAEYQKLTKEQRQQIDECYLNTFNHSQHLGSLIANAHADQSAETLLEEMLAVPPATKSRRASSKKEPQQDLVMGEAYRRFRI